jgi:hypothetical protein
MDMPSFDEFLRSGQLDAQFYVSGVKAAAGCWKGEWLYAIRYGDGPGVVHRMKDSMSSLEAFSKLLASHLERIRTEEREAPHMSSRDVAFLRDFLASSDNLVQELLTPQDKGSAT